MRVEGSRSAVGEIAPLVRDFLGEVANRRPDHNAIESDARTLTYRELLQASDGVAHALIAAACVPQAAVSVLVSDWPTSIVAVVGALTAGLVPVPLDPRDPADRLAVIHRDTGASVVLTDRATAAFAAATFDQARAIVVGDVPPADAPPECVIDPHGPGVLYYTSGSTGTPKGVLRDHQSTVTAPLDSAATLAITADDRVALSGSVGFAGPYTRAFLSLAIGSTLVVFDLHEDGVRGIPEWTRAHDVTVLQFVPSRLRALVDAMPPAPGADPPMRCVRLVTFGGETVFGRDVERARPLFGPDTVFMARYALNEAGAVAVHTITAADEEDGGQIPLGVPDHDVEVRVVDDDGDDVAPGEPGLLVVISDEVGLGYWHDPELTAERFFSLPDHRRGVRTSDRVRMRPDGVLEHLGRADDRVKVRGAMVSPSEVERALVHLDGISAAAVRSFPTADGGWRLVGFIVLEGDDPPGVWRVRRDLAAQLPWRMVPAVIVTLDSLPLGQRGKVDRAALAEPPPPRSSPNVERDLVGRERAVAELFCEVLGLEQVGLHDDFFELGGDSLAAIELVAAIEDRCSVRLDTAVLLEAPTVAALTPKLVLQRPRGAPTVVQLHDGPGAPFFCVAGGGAPAVSLRALADALDDRSCYGIQARGLEERSRPDRSVEACARRYLAEVRAIQPLGPYRIGGFSFGGLVAFEMACRLQDAGERVALLALIDPPPPNMTSTPFVLRWDPHDWVSHIRHAFRLASAGIVHHGVRQYGVFNDLSKQFGRAYHPATAFAGPTLVAYTDDDDPDKAVAAAAWAPLLDGTLSTIALSGKHDRIIRRPHVVTLASELGRALDAVS